MKEIARLINEKEYRRALDRLNAERPKADAGPAAGEIPDLSIDDALYLEGIILSNLKKDTEAAACFEKLLANGTADFGRRNQVRMLLGYLYARGGDNPKSLENFRQVVDEDFNCSAAHCGLGFIYARIGKHKEAITAYQTAIQVDPGNATAHHSLGYLLAETRNDVVRGIYECQEALRLNDESAACYDSLAWALYLAGNVEMAQDTIKQAAEKEPDNQSIKKHFTIIMNTRVPPHPRPDKTRGKETVL